MSEVVLVSAAILIVLLGVAHSVLGERYLIGRLLRRDDLPKIFGSDGFTKRTLRFAWHLTSVAWWGIAAIVIVAASAEPDFGLVLRSIAVTSAVSAVIAGVISRGKHLSWVVFVLIAVLTWMGGNGASSSDF